MTPLERIRGELAPRVPAAGLAWLDAAIAAARQGDREAVASAFPALGRRLGRERLGSTASLPAGAGDRPVPLRAWRLDDAGRVALLCAFAGDAAALARELYLSGDLRERAGALRGLAVVGRGAVGLEPVRDALRVAAVELVEAAVADNPYTSAVLPDEEFRRAVLKAVFLGIPIDRVDRVEERADAELSRLLLSYVTEREVAGRPVPPDLWQVVALNPPSGLVAKLCGYLEHPAEAHRAGAALGLARAGDRRARPFLEDRLARETDAGVRQALARALERAAP
jgi:HEAT repeats